LVVGKIAVLPKTRVIRKQLITACLVDHGATVGDIDKSFAAVL
jgi:hypothetical protein